MNPTRDQQLAAAFHESPIHVGPFPMRPITLASYDVMLRTKNPFVLGESPDEGTEEFTSSVLAFVFVHCAPWAQVVGASFDLPRFRHEALIFCGELTPDDFRSAFAAMEQQGKQLAAAQVETIGDTLPGKSSPATSPAS